MVIGLFGNPNHVSVCLSNLREADFPAEEISVVTANPAQAATLARVSGALQGLSPSDLAKALVERGVPADVADRYGRAIESGAILIAVSSPEAADAAAEMLHDHGARDVQTVGQ
jgi:hypothetical protein